MKNRIILLIALSIINYLSFGQDTTTYKLRLSLSLIDLPQNYSLPYYLPSMNQSFELSNDFYELSFWGIDALGDLLFISSKKPYTKGRKLSNTVFKYGLSLIFSKFGSELPIPLGVWGHEEFHRSVLGIDNISSKNGNWLLNRWDGTVYGISDQTLTQLKNNNINTLLYSYVSGVQFEIALNQKVTLNDFYKRRSLNKTALLLYNAYYVYDYFRFSASAKSDSVKVLAPPNESPYPEERDYAGADLTAWVYDMFNPLLPFDTRDPFPDGEGVNRRIGFSDLSSEAQSYLTKQKKLSLLNFLNPSIFFINRIKLTEDLSFNFFTQYTPTHFGNDVAFFLPLKYNQFDILLNLHNYSNKTVGGLGIGVGLYNYRFNEKIEADLTLNFWNQPKTFFDNSKIFGGQMSITSKYYFRNNFSAFVSATGKSNGWIIANPYLNRNLSFYLGLNYNLRK